MGGETMEPLEHKRLRKLQELGQDRPLVAGSLNRIERRDARGRTAGYYLPTFKEAAKTRSVYVPKDLVKEVQSWVRNHRRVRQLLSEISTLSIAIIQRHVPEKKASARGAGADRRARRNNP
jgi:hypothetical protein